MTTELLFSPQSRNRRFLSSADWTSEVVSGSGLNDSAGSVWAERVLLLVSVRLSLRSAQIFMIMFTSLLRLKCDGCSRHLIWGENGFPCLWLLMIRWSRYFDEQLIQKQKAIKYKCTRDSTHSWVQTVISPVHENIQSFLNMIWFSVVSGAATAEAHGYCSI